MPSPSNPRASRKPRVHDVAVLALKDVVAFDLCIPCEVFGSARTPEGHAPYRVLVCGETKEVRSEDFGVHARFPLSRAARAHTVVIPGIADLDRPIPKAVIKVIRRAWANGARIASICSGAFVLGATGLLDGRRATTHWLATSQFACRFPKVDLDPKVLFVDEGRIITSAGMLAGMDMCLHLVRRDHGQAMAVRSARRAVAPLDRDGGQAQYIQHELPASRESLAPLLEWMTANVERPLSVEILAARACSSPRTFARRFLEQTGTTPLKWLHAARVRRAQDLLESTTIPIDRVANAAGFESPVTFRTRFQRIVGVSPAAYRRHFSPSGRDANAE